MSLAATAGFAALLALTSCSTGNDSPTGAGSEAADCNVILTLNGVHYFGVAGVKMELAEPVGTGTIPPCYDTGFTPPEYAEPVSQVEVHRIKGVDQADAVGAGHSIFVANIDSMSDPIPATVQAVLDAPRGR